MARQFFTPIALPADATAALQATTKQQMDAADALAVKVAGDIGGSAATPKVVKVARTITYAATITPDASVLGDIINVTATGNLTVAAPTSPVDGQQLRVCVLASGATRTVTFSGVGVSTGITLGPYSVPSTQLFIGVLIYSSLKSGWILTAATVSA